ncbi:uncharacterized protein DSM5745_11143 [Aspergillus mulundensis]|uniref:Uncharacterized protein n=1 Tax=Aspergillus mulundensis TaxID=1810919 RepID=A0A3D8QB64_9EURO|nr:hypothetical protein DSM5745_11143 [Aspergillus mulundensis]RDW58937.1 hypothetical protein DSM5745_11143 [Aspergillus mulundensis]
MAMTKMQMQVVDPPTPSKPCTTYETMCSHCKFHYVQLRHLAVLPEDLTYTRGTFPVIFTIHVKLDLGLDEKLVHVDHGESAVQTMRAKLLETYFVAVPIYSHYSSRTENGTTHVHQSLLFDFPWRVNGTKAWRAFVARYVSIAVFEKRHTFRPKARVMPAPEEWEVTVPGAQEEGHLCWVRLRWFLEREGVGAFI